MSGIGSWGLKIGIWTSGLLGTAGSIVTTITSLNSSDLSLFAEEICDNAMDDDGDGLIDLNDSDCICTSFEPESLIPNPSFEDQRCCPRTLAQLFCAEAWIQASDPTTDLISSCNWMGFPEFPPPLPFPDGNSIVGFRDGRVIGGIPDRNWKEYAGACLLSPLKAGKRYKFEFYIGFVNADVSPAINISFFGTTTCINLPFGRGNEEFGCPTNGPGWTRLKSAFVYPSGNNEWVKASLEVVMSEDIHAIAIGPDCPALLVNNSTYYFFDNLVLNDFKTFAFDVKEEKHPCNPGFLLSVPSYEELTYQWYKDGIALIGETESILTKIYGEGTYQVRSVEGTSCRLSKEYEFKIPVIDTMKRVVVCEDETFSFGKISLSKSGVYIDTFSSINGCDSIVTLTLRVLGQLDDTVQALIFEGEQYEIGRFSYEDEGEYVVNLLSEMGCDSLVLLQLSHYNVFFPNIFSPNNDGFNDKFNVMASDGLINETVLTIFDRWGNIVHVGPSWEGKSNGEVVSSGVYAYRAFVRMYDGVERDFYGSVTVLK